MADCNCLLLLNKNSFGYRSRSRRPACLVCGPDYFDLLTQTRPLPEAEPMVCDLIAIHLDVPKAAYRWRNRRRAKASSALV